MQNWKKYERFVASLCSEEYQSPNVTVTPNAKLQGVLSGTSRQVDVLIDKRFPDDRERRVIVDAKKYTRRLNIKDVEEFHGMMIDCGVSKGVLVSPNGFSEAAKERAQDFIDLKIASSTDLDTFNLSEWDDCLSDNCDSKAHRGLILWDSPFGLSAPEMPVSISCVGKCDVCGDFHVWCWDCGQKFHLTNVDEHKCDCDTPWFWLTCIEDELDDKTKKHTKYVYLLLPTLTDVLFVDRKPLAYKKAQ